MKMWKLNGLMFLITLNVISSGRLGKNPGYFVDRNELGNIFVEKYHIHKKVSPIS